MNARLTALFVALICLAASPSTDPVISVDVRDASLADVIALLAEQSGVNVVADGSVHSERITLHLSNVRFHQALTLLAAAHGLVVVRRADALVVGTPEALDREQGAAPVTATAFRLRYASAEDVQKSLATALPSDAIVLADKRTNSLVVTGDAIAVARARSLVEALDVDAGAGRPAETQTVAFRLRFSRAPDVAKELKALLPDDEFVADEQENAIIVIGNSDVREHAREAIANLDVPGPQVLFEVRVADVTPVNDSSDFGLEFGGLDLQGEPLSGGATYAFTGASVAINVRLNAMLAKGRAQILATPRLVTLNGKEADLLIGETYPVVYSTSVLGSSNVQFVDVGVKLRLTPVIGPDGSVTAELHPEYSEVQGFTSAGYPIIANRKIDSTLRVKSGETIVLGGLLRDSSSETISRVPWLSDIPVLGKFFENKQASRERDEIVFLITPHIIDPQVPPTH